MPRNHQPTPLRRGRGRGFAWRALPLELDSRLGGWLAARTVPEGQLLSSRVFRWGPVAIKFSGPGRLRDALRPSPARRAAAWHARLAPLRTPAPWVLLDERRGCRLVESMLVSEFIEGASLAEVWGRDERAVEALPDFLAALYRAHAMHGDLHPGNLLWDGDEWVLLDLEALRNLLHRPLALRNALRQWGRLRYHLQIADPAAGARIRQLFDRFCGAARVRLEPERAWRQAARALERRERADAAAALRS